MTPDRITAIAAAGESETIEFKKSTAEKDRACRTLEELAREFQGFEPPLFPAVARVAIGAKREVLVLTVERGARVPVSFRGVAYERVLNTTRTMQRDRYQRLLLAEMHTTVRWENRPAADWDVSRLDHREMVLTLEESIRRGRMDDPGTREPLEILRGLGLLVDDERVSRAAVVLFCKDDVQLPDFPQLLLKVARFKGVRRDEFLDNRQFHGNAFKLMRRAERFLIDSLPVAGRIVPGQMERVDTPLLPVEALREALANAFVHRDYAIGGGSVGVALFDDRLEVISIGDLHFGLTPEALFREHESKPWNPMIAGTFYRRGIIETWGRGTLKIARLMREAGHEPPTVSLREGAVVVTFGLPVESTGKTPGKTTGKMTGERQGNARETLGKTPTKILELLKNNPDLSVPQLAALMHKSESAIHRAIRILRDSGLLERVGPDRGGRWKVIE